LKIKVDSIENPYPNMEVFLRDNLTMDTYDIKNETFEISLAEGEYNEQYSVVFKAKEETSIEVEEIFSLLNVFVNENNTLIKIQKPEELTIQEISLFNAIGQQLKIWNTNFNKNEINLPINVASGIYLVHIKTNNGNNIKKIIIN
ncbi:T9SS type A sorting domain-containing protein, partial [Lutibacter litoralis]